MPATPTTFPSAKAFLVLCKETAGQGTPATTNPWLYPLSQPLTVKDNPVYIVDPGMRNSMVDEYGMVQGVISVAFSAQGWAFFDGIGFLLNNILGDIVESGTYTGSGTTTLSATVAAGVTSITTALSIANGTRIQIDTGVLSEVVVTSGPPTGSGPFTIPVPALRFGHTGGVTVQPVTTPYQQQFAVLNSGTGQPGSLTGYDWQGMPASTNVRQIPGMCLTQLVLKGNAESSVVEFTCTGIAWPSSDAGSPPAATATNAPGIAAWRTQLGLAGPASGGTLVRTAREWTVTINRKARAEWTLQNLQTPLIVQRGAAQAALSLLVPVPADETVLNYYLANTQPQGQLLVSNGLAGANLLSLQIDAALTGFNSGEIVRNEEAAGYNMAAKLLSNTTNSGNSGGYTPLKITTQNAIVAGTY